MTGVAAAWWTAWRFDFDSACSAATATTGAAKAGRRAGGSRMATREARSWCCWCWGWVTPCCTRVVGLTSSLASGSGCTSSSPASTSRSTSGRSTTPTPGIWMNNDVGIV